EMKRDGGTTVGHRVVRSPLLLRSWTAGPTFERSAWCGAKAAVTPIRLGLALTLGLLVLRNSHVRRNGCNGWRERGVTDWQLPRTPVTPTPVPAFIARNTSFTQTLRPAG